MKLQGAYKAIKSNPLLDVGIQSARWMSKFLLNASSGGALTTSQDNWFHCLTALTVRKFFLIFNTSLASCNLSPFLHVLHSGMMKSWSCPCSVWQPFKYLKSAIISPLCHLFSRLNMPSSFSLFLIGLGFQLPDQPPLLPSSELVPIC